MAAPEKDKKAMGNGYLSIEVAEVTSGVKAYICVFRSSIGKTLFQASLSGKFSKKRRIEEKAYK